MLSAVLIGSAIMVPVQFMFSSYSDRNGRKGVFMAGAALTAVWAFAIFPLMASGSFLLAVEYKKHDVPCEVHVYAKGGHGFGKKKKGLPVYAWPDRVL